jgi:hypothetical protein
MACKDGRTMKHARGLRVEGFGTGCNEMSIYATKHIVMYWVYMERQ